MGILNLSMLWQDHLLRNRLLVLNLKLRQVSETPGLLVVLDVNILYFRSRLTRDHRSC